MAKVQEMTVRYELAINENSFFLIEIKFELMVFYLFIVLFIWKWLKEIFLPYTHCCIHIHLNKNEESAWVSIPVPPAC